MIARVAVDRLEVVKESGRAHIAVPAAHSLVLIDHGVWPFLDFHEDGA